MDFKTRCIHGHNNKFDNTGAVSMPIFQSATFSHIGVGESTGFDYSRLNNPTRDSLEKTVASLENGIDAMAFSTGMAAITALMEIFNPGDHIIGSDDLYGGTHRLFYNLSNKNGISCDLTDTSCLSSIKEKIKENTKAIFIETPTNPMMHITDIKAVSEMAKSKNILVIVDNTFLTPYYQKPLDLGADIVMHSGTKYLGGHNDTLAGFLVTNSKVLSEKLRYIFKTTGACLAPFDSWLILRGIKTLAVRMDKQQENAIKIADWLSRNPKINKVFFPGLKDSPGYEISLKQATGFGAMISFETDTVETAVQILEKVKVIKFAESLGGVESLITYPMTQTHADIPEAEREAKGINNRLLRLSVGLEDVNDLIGDLSNAINSH